MKIGTKVFITAVASIVTGGFVLVLIITNIFFCYTEDKNREDVIKISKNISFKIIICILIIIFIAGIVSCLIYINNIVIKKILRLSSFVDKVVERNDVSLRIDVSGNDEISKLSNNINNMLEKLENNFIHMQIDTVTNLKNRAYMDNVLKNLDENNNFCILMADVNGLKLINDTFGHKEGDRLLWTVGYIFKICCSNTDIPVRWGGDEFLILIMNNKEYADNLLKRIKAECLAVDGFPIRLNLAIGCAAKSEGYSYSDEVIKIAEERMYRNKLLESRSVRNSVISSLEQSLKQKQIENRGHTERVKEICLKIGKELELTQNELDELALLSLLHDIGKIAVPDYILMKSEKLTEEETEIIKTHAEIGCRIARSISDLSHISDKILAHHERYDGKGYPRGLSKLNIPKAARILAVADSFDIMTYGTIHKKPINIDEALRKIESNSGTQFDPEIVKVFLNMYK